MPVRQGRDKEGPYFQWGSNGKKYHYSEGCKACRDAARRKAAKQGQAARAAGYKG